MTLIVDKRTLLNKKGAGTHALVIGVSAHAFLPDFDDPPSDATWGLRSIGATAISAAYIADYLISATDLARPLKTLRVLLSPTKQELALLPAWAAQAATPTQQEMKKAIWDWHEDCRDSRDSVAFFSFSGHGLSHNRNDSGLVLVAADFFKPGEPRLNQLVSAMNILGGMAPQDNLDEVARQQFFLFDCCRTYDNHVVQFDEKSVPNVLDVVNKEGVRDDRRLLRGYAVPFNDAAFATAGEKTYFGAAVLDALQKSGRSADGGDWQVDGLAIQGRVNARYPVGTSRTAEFTVTAKSPLLRTLPGAPKVDVLFLLDPHPGNGQRQVSLESAPNPRTVCVEGAQGHAADVDADQYKLDVGKPGGAWSTVLTKLPVLPEISYPFTLRNWP